MKFNQVQKALLLILSLLCSPLFSQENEEFYASAEKDNVLVLEPSYTSSVKSKVFEKKYHYLIARSYFKLLAQAQDSERKLRKEFERYSSKNEKLGLDKNDSFQTKLELASSKYKAHSALLTGLKSWNLFSKDRTADMFYFMAENEDRIFKMYRGNLSEDKMVNYLIYKLADLYHVEGEN
jgi:hypothetical protein